MSAGAHDGTLTTISFGTLGSNFVTGIRGLRWSGSSRDSIDLTHTLSQTSAPHYETVLAEESLIMEKVPGAVVDWGELQVDLVHNAAQKPLNLEPVENITIVFAKSAPTVTTQAQWLAAGFVTQHEFDEAWKDMAGGTLTIPLTPNGTNLTAMAFTVEA